MNKAGICAKQYKKKAGENIDNYFFLPGIRVVTVVLSVSKQI